MYFNYVKIKNMKKRLKNLGLAWLTSLALWWAVKEGISQTTQGTNKAIQADLIAAKDWKDKAVKTYVATAADFKEQVGDITQVLKDMSQDTAQLVEFYGKNGLNIKVHQIVKEHPNFASLTIKQQEAIIQQFFWDFIDHKKEAPLNWRRSFFLMIALFTLNGKRIFKGK